MPSMYTVDSDRDYYGDYDQRDEEEEERCLCCGAHWAKGEACEETCETRVSGFQARTAEILRAVLGEDAA